MKEKAKDVQQKPTITFQSINKDGKFYMHDGTEISDAKYTKEVESSTDLNKKELDEVITGFFYAENKLINVRKNLLKLFEA